eukprot:PhF_6_TR28087/c0_g1_i2/m.41508
MSHTLPDSCSQCYVSVGLRKSKINCGRCLKPLCVACCIGNLCPACHENNTTTELRGGTNTSFPSSSQSIQTSVVGMPTACTGCGSQSTTTRCSLCRNSTCTVCLTLVNHQGQQKYVCRSCRAWPQQHTVTTPPQQALPSQVPLNNGGGVLHQRPGSPSSHLEAIPGETDEQFAARLGGAAEPPTHSPHIQSNTNNTTQQQHYVQPYWGAQVTSGGSVSVTPNPF